MDAATISSLVAPSQRMFLFVPPPLVHVCLITPTLPHHTSCYGPSCRCTKRTHSGDLGRRDVISTVEEAALLVAYAIYYYNHDSHRDYLLYHNHGGDHARGRKHRS